MKASLHRPIGFECAASTTRRRRWLSRLWIAICLVAATATQAQISPGELSRAHASYDRSSDCLQCHGPKRGVDAERCLSCHQVLNERLLAGRGFHSQLSSPNACERCHIEHHGRDFELVWWGEQGQASFDHGQTGLELQGAHRKASCRDCHRAAFIASPSPLLAAGKDLSRTFLGLESHCLACHEDEHQQQFAGRECTECHGQSNWQPVPAFDHDTTSFPLTGLHRGMRCESCHRRKNDPPKTAERLSAGSASGHLVFEVEAFSACSACHEDPHDNRMPGSCDKCHSTSGWGKIDLSGFDHRSTRFALQGAHRDVRCSGCHRGDGFRVARFAACFDCHADPHGGQLERPAGDRSRAPAGVDCESCHNVETFHPSSFAVAQHQATAFQLEGAHLAVACIDCHGPPGRERMPSFAAVELGELGRAGWLFRFGEPGCADCHADPHEGELNGWMDATGCETCHRIDDWLSVDFDHDATDFPLRDAHLQAACLDCHRTRSPAGTLRMSDAQTDCAACHEDPHRGQLAESDGTTQCQSCHRSDSWQSVLFDHDLQSTFPLTGAHRAVPCRACHRLESTGGLELVRFKPLSARCESCHAAASEPRR